MPPARSSAGSRSGRRSRSATAIWAAWRRSPASVQWSASRGSASPDSSVGWPGSSFISPSSPGSRTGSRPFCIGRPPSSATAAPSEQSPPSRSSPAPRSRRRAGGSFYSGSFPIRRSMMMRRRSPMIGEREVDGFPGLTMGSSDGDLEVTFVPGAGMVGCSLRHHAEELLGQRGGLRTYVSARSTMGIPLLYPWANRVASRRFRVAGREVNLDLASPPPSLDPNGLPIHGLLAAAEGWRVERHEARGDGGLLAARFDFGAQPGLMAAFPFPHELTIEATLKGLTLTVATTVEASGDIEVPISFGYHPYF